MTVDQAPGHPTAMASSSTRIPQVFTSFVGRESDVHRVTTMLGNDEIRLVTITGFGGIGKTPLAMAVAQYSEPMWQRIWFVSLAHTHESIAAGSLIARQFGRDPDSNAPVDSTFLHDLNTSRCLLILDNFEQVLDAADQVGDIVQSWPLLKVLVTSRTPLRLAAEHLYVLDPLNVRTPQEPGSAMRLFAERARAHRHDFTLTQENAGAVQRLCDRLEGIPLAIELAAARVATIPPADMLNRLDSQLTLLTGGPRDAPARQRTLRDTILWSYQLLPVAEQHTLNALSVFSGGFSIAAASAVLTVPEPVAVDLIGALLASHLIQPAPSLFNETPRYRLLDPVREFAFDLLTDNGRARETQLAHARYFLNLAEDAIPLYDGPELLTALQAIATELDNFRAAIPWSLVHGNREHGVRMAGALWRNWAHRYMGDVDLWSDRFLEGFRLTQLALQFADGLPHEATREAMIGMPYLCANLEREDDLEHAIANLDAHATASQDPDSMYWAAFARWRVNVDITGTIPEAEEYLERMDALAMQMRQPENQRAGVYLSIGEHLLAAGEHQRAEPILHQGMALAAQCGNPLYLAWSSQIRGHMESARGNHLAALTWYRESFGIHDELDPTYWNANSYNAIAQIAARVDRFDLAIRMLAPHTRMAQTRFSYDNAERELGGLIGREALREGLAAAPLFTLEGRDALIDELERHLRQEPSSPVSWVDDLTPRERDVFAHLAEGASNRAIAERLFISERTVENHVQHILTKLQLPNRAAAAAWWVRHHPD